MEFAQKINDFNIYVLADYFRSDGPKLRVDVDRALKTYGAPYSAAPGDSTSDFESYSLQTQMNYQNFYFSGFFLNLSENTPFGYLLSLSDENRIKVNPTYFAELGYKQPVLYDGNLDIKAYYDFFSYNGTYEMLSEQTMPIFNRQFPATPYPAGESEVCGPQGKYAKFGSEATLSSKVLPSLMLTGGAMYEYVNWYDIVHLTEYNNIGRPLTFNGITYLPNQYMGGMRDISDVANWNKPATRNNSALYGQGELDLKNLTTLEGIGHLLKLTAGVRYDNYSDIGSSVNPRMGLVYAPVEPLTLKVLYGTAFRAPTFRELYNINNPSFVGNPNLKPEKANTLEGLIGYKFSRSLEANLTAFSTSIQDAIQFIRLTAPYENFGKLTSQGFEAEVRYSFETKKYAYLNATYQDVKNISHAVITSGARSYTQEDFNVGYIPVYIANLGLNYDFIQNLSADISINYNGERKRKGEMAFNSAGDLVLADQRGLIPARFLANLSVIVGKFDFAKALELRLSVYNLFNVDQRDPEPAGSLPNDLPRPARSYMTEVSYGF